MTTESIVSFQTTFVGSPRQMHLIRTPIKSTWVPEISSKYSGRTKGFLPAYVEAVDSSLRETLVDIELPSRFEKNQLYSVIMDSVNSYLKSNMQRFAKISKETSIRDNPQTFVKALRNYTKELDTTISSQISMLSKMTLQSDIPLDVFYTLALSLYTYQNLFSYVTEKAGFASRIVGTKGYRPRTIHDIIERYLKNVDPIMSMYSGAVQKQLKLLLYIDLANSRSYEEVLKPKTPNYGSMNPQTFENYYLDFQYTLNSFRRFFYKETPSFLDTEIDHNDPASFLWTSTARKSIGGPADEQQAVFY